jgi:hypothetical protein
VGVSKNLLARLVTGETARSRFRGLRSHLRRHGASASHQGSHPCRLTQEALNLSSTSTTSNLLVPPQPQTIRQYETGLPHVRRHCSHCQRLRCNMTRPRHQPSSTTAGKLSLQTTNPAAFATAGNFSVAMASSSGPLARNTHGQPALSDWDNYDYHPGQPHDDTCLDHPSLRDRFAPYNASVPVPLQRRQSSHQAQSTLAMFFHGMPLSGPDQGNTASRLINGFQPAPDFWEEPQHFPSYGYPDFPLPLDGSLCQQDHLDGSASDCPGSPRCAGSVCSGTDCSKNASACDDDDCPAVAPADDITCEDASAAHTLQSFGYGIGQQFETSFQPANMDGYSGIDTRKSAICYGFPSIESVRD